MTEYQRELAARAVRCMKGYNRNGALALMARCQEVAPDRKPGTASNQGWRPFGTKRDQQEGNQEV